MKNNFIICSVSVLIILFGSCFEVAAAPATYVPSNQPLMIRDLEYATVSFMDRPYNDFGVKFKGGTDSNVYANPLYFGCIINPAISYWDANTALVPTPLIVQPVEDDHNPVIFEGDTVTITYDGGQELTIYLPYMDGSLNWDNLFVATDGSTYFYYDTDTDTLRGLAAAAPASQVVVNPHPNEHANPRASNGRFNYLNSQKDPSNEPLTIQDLEYATVSFMDRPYNDFGVKFKGGTDSNVYANPLYFGCIINPAISYWDANTALVPTPLIVQPVEDDHNPVISEGDTVTIIYDGGQELTVYLPYMDGSLNWDNLFVATDGSTYFNYDTDTDTLRGLAATAP